MWCTSCQSDVAAEVSSDSTRIHCAICGNDLGSTAAARISDKTKEARELLARWSNREILDPYGPLTKAESRVQEASSLFAPSEKPHSEIPKPQVAEPRRDTETPQSAPISESVTAQAETSSWAEETAGTDEAETEDTQDYYQPATPRLHSDYRDIQSLIEEEDQKPNWLGLVGQLMAYGGVAVLTIGTTLVLWGYYGGPANYASTGWLISTAGQMLLFLGVITLVSAGMEQTSNSVSRRIDRLGQRIFLFEQAMLEQQETERRKRSVSPSGKQTTANRESELRKSA
ncbi:hypothetical protein Pan153_53870 [Gimesia panareensis]|uniref:Uncharacterized protein n=1 Tax=Gimesia panareensis TaxID=2527978 RepID=A0A518FWI4_9PLAN|nr:hypothetical protein [Gimesia panareensis]QDV20709.1 hypothetical protein Pan153_53870 [Gimesia panareensis]